MLPIHSPFRTALAVAILGPTLAFPQSVAILHTFEGGSGDGASPFSTLIEVSGTIYGTTSQGGTLNSGTIFKLSPITGVATVVYSFRGGADGLGGSPALIEVAGSLYGTTYSGGTAAHGTVYRLSPNTGTEAVIHTFASSEGHPNSSLIYFNGMLYGTTLTGGTGACGSGCGTIYQMAPLTGAYKVVYSFAGGGDGVNPNGPLLHVGKSLYGTTAFGGAYSAGTVFVLNPISKKKVVLYSFEGPAANPSGALISVQGFLYGTTNLGGSGGCGELFKIKPTGADLSVLHTFSQGNDGCNPQDALTLLNGSIYGTTPGGGELGLGALYKVDLATGVESNLYNFGGGKNGAYPSGALLHIGGTLYGTTSSGGNTGCGGNGCGTVFSITP